MIHTSTWREAAKLLHGSRTTNNAGTMTDFAAYEHGQQFPKQRRKILLLSMYSMQEQEYYSIMSLYKQSSESIVTRSLVPAGQVSFWRVETAMPLINVYLGGGAYCNGEAALVGPAST